MTFTQWIIGIFILFTLAIFHQASLGEVTANLDQPVYCKIVVYEIYVDELGNEGMVTSLKTIKGWASAIIDHEYFTVDFTNDMVKRGLPERWNPYVQDRMASDCAIDTLPVPSGAGAGRMEARFKGDSEDY